MTNTTQTTSSRALLVGTGTSNLYRNAATGIYYLRTKIQGKEVRLSLDCDKLSKATVKLAEKLAELRQQAAAGIKRNDDMTFGECIDAVFAKEEERNRIKKLDDNSIDSLRECRRKLYETWGMEIRDLPVRKIDAAQLIKKHNDLHTEFCATYVNGVKRLFVSAFDVAVQAKVITANPALQLSNKVPKAGKKLIPSDTQLKELLEYISSKKNCFSKKKQVRNLIEFLCWFGCRIEESRHVLKKHVNLDLDNGGANPTVHFVETKNGRERYVPIAPGALPLIQKLLADETTGDRLLGCGEALKTLAASCLALGQPKWVHHTFRHYFATKALVATGCDFFTVAYWLGHRDGGKLLAGLYAHLDHKHSADQIKKLQLGFSTLGSLAPTPSAAATPLKLPENGMLMIGGHVLTSAQLEELVKRHTPTNLVQFPAKKTA